MPTLFLSPSRAEDRPTASGLTEKQVMSFVADAVRALLKENGVAVVSAGTGTTTETVKESNLAKPDLHLSLITNTAPAGRRFRGIQAFYFPSSVAGRRAAQALCDSLKSVYPDPDLVYILPATHVTELTKTTAPAVQLALGYRDDPRDSQWLKNNVQEVAGAIARGVTDTFSLPYTDVCAGAGQLLTAGNAAPGSFVRVCTGGSARLNLRAGASMNSAVLGQIPPGQKALLLEPVKNGWAKLRYQAVEGYAGAMYLCVCEEAAGPAARVNTEGGFLNLRAQPSLKAAIIGRIPDNATVALLSAEKAWARVTYQDVSGYVLREFLK